MDIIEDTKIIFIDIDGTLTNSEKRITDKTKEIIKKIIDNGILVVLCSGRPNPYTIEKSIEINASNITLSNSGNLVYDYKNDKIIAINEINKNDLIDIFNYCNSLKIDCALNGVKKRYKNKYSKREGVNINAIKDVDEPICQLSIDIFNFEDALKFYQYINNSSAFGIGFISESFLIKNMSADKYEFDVMNKNFGKGDGIRYLLQYLNIQISETMCFGDYINDYSMFKECDITVAMGNATKRLKELADFVTLTNDKDGVAYFLEQELLNKK